MIRFANRFVVLFTCALAMACNISDDVSIQAPSEPDPVLCDEDTCPANSACSIENNEIVCTCDEGYVGASCEGCASGYQDNDGDGVCRPSCATSDIDCGSNGSCTDVSGEARCDCDTTYTGETCRECEDGFQDDNSDGTCEADCATAGLECGEFGSCDTATGTAVCACDEGYVGSACDTCAEGFQDEDSNGTCEPTCATSGLDCGDFGECLTTSGSPVCECDPEYTGDTCGQCAEGYQDNDGDGVCRETCEIAGLSCSNQRLCSDESGTAECVCGPGDPCVACPDDEQDEDGNGVCAPVCGEETAWWDPEWRNRLHVEVTNPAASSDPLTVGTPVTVVFDHATEVAEGRSLASGDDVRVVWVDADGNTTELARVQESGGWDQSEVEIAFALQEDVPVDSTAGDYWLYWNNATAASPPLATFPAPPEWAISDDDDATLECDRRRGSFYSIQLRQLMPNSSQYEVYANEHTSDSSAFGTIVVRDTAGGVIFQKTYNDLGGSCCSPVVDGDTSDVITIAESQFTVELTSREFSGSNRYFGCSVFATRNPTLTGTTIRAYTVKEISRDPAMTCDRGELP